MDFPNQEDQEEPSQSLFNSRTNPFAVGSASTSSSRGTTSGNTGRRITHQNSPPLFSNSAFAEDQSSLEHSSEPSLPIRSPPSSSSRNTNISNTSALISNPISQVEKDVDDPTTPISRQTLDTTTTGTALSKLLVTTNSPSDSRNPSYMNVSAIRSTRSDGASLPDHIYRRGLLNGRHSDITVVAFDNEYKLHRLILDRAPFFANALTEPWLESSAKRITLHPEEVDINITQVAFELALKRLYGVDISVEQDVEAIGLFATGCWLEMQDLVDTSIESILRQMSPKTLASLIRLVTSNYYGRAGERILASAKAMLCRDGWEMPLKYWDNIPGNIVREMVGGDGFFIGDEWDRWVLATRILDRRLQQTGFEFGLLDLNRKSKPEAPNSPVLNAIRFDKAYRHQVMAASESQQQVQPLEEWTALYMHPDIEPLLVLLDEDIYYVHLDFEQLQYIRQAHDFFSLPIVSDRTVMGAMWQSLELRQKVMSARDNDLELGLSQPTEQWDSLRRSSTETNSSAVLTPMSEFSSGLKGKQAIEFLAYSSEVDPTIVTNDSSSPRRKFWIPSKDSNNVIGGSSNSVGTNIASRHASRFSGDGMWSSDAVFSSSPSSSSENQIAQQKRSGSSSGPSPPISYSHFPPFRFAAEFPHPKTLKVRKRVYSRTIFYAGSLWNIYIQKVKSLKGVQLGVYLHRAKEYETEPGSGIPAPVPRTVDERINILEREMLQRRARVGLSHRRMGSDAITEAEDSSSEDSSDEESTLITRSSIRQISTGTDHTLSTFPALPSGLAGSDSESSPDHTTFPTSVLNHNRSHISNEQPATSRPTLPPYVDSRPTIKTYFKIYSPSKGGRLLSVYESAPDKFNFRQSWGWRSSTLMLDEGLETSTEEGSVSVSKGDGKLRFCVVIGNL